MHPSQRFPAEPIIPRRQITVLPPAIRLKPPTAGAFVWADSQGVNFSSTNNNSFNVRAQGGARFVTSGAGLAVDGPVTATSLTGNGSGLTALNGSQITSGTVADARLSANVPLLNTGNTYTGLNVYNNLIKVVGPVSNNGYFGFLEEDTSDTGDFWILTKWDNVGNKRFSIYDGNGVTPIVFQEHGGNVGIGTNQPGALLEVNGNAKIDGPVTAASFSGNGGGLTALNAASLTTGTVADGLLSANVALCNAGNNFTGGQNTFTGYVGIGLSVAPGAPLDVFGTMRVANSAGQFAYVGFPAGPAQTAILGQFLTSDTNYPQLRFSRLMGGSLVDIGQDGNGNFGVFGNTVERLTVNTNGNVGIGTPTPTSTLQSERHGGRQRPACSGSGRQHRHLCFYPTGGRHQYRR